MNKQRSLNIDRIKTETAQSKKPYEPSANKVKQKKSIEQEMDLSKHRVINLTTTRHVQSKS